MLDYGKLSAFEQEAMDSMLATRKADIQLGVDFCQISRRVDRVAQALCHFRGWWRAKEIVPAADNRGQQEIPAMMKTQYPSSALPVCAALAGGRAGIGRHTTQTAATASPRPPLRRHLNVRPLPRLPHPLRLPTALAAAPLPKAASAVPRRRGTAGGAALSAGTSCSTDRAGRHLAR